MMKLILALSFFISFVLHANDLPTPEEVQGVINVCSAGRSVKVSGELGLAFKKLFDKGVDGQGETTDIGGIIGSIEDDQLKTKVFEMYQKCVMPLLHKNLNKKEGSVFNNQGDVFINQGNSINQPTISNSTINMGK